MNPWLRQLRYDPLPQLAQADNEALSYFLRRDLLEEEVDSIGVLWQTPQVVKTIDRQESNGSWRYHGGKESIRSQRNYDQLETYRVLGQLIEKYGLTREHPAIRKAADFLFTFQIEEGDFRGIYENQYTPNYSAAIMELLIKVGYGEDPRIDKGFAWLLSLRQRDGGWSIPFRTVADEAASTFHRILRNPKPIQPDRSKPFSHLITGVVLRAFAAHQEYRKTAEAKLAGELLALRFFKPDTYVDRKAVSFWTKIRYPFWFTDVVSALDSLSLLGFSREDSRIERAIDWLITNQRENGLWKSSFESRGDGDYWVSLAICRILKRF